MNSTYLDFLKKLFIYTAIIALISYGAFYFLPEKFTTNTWPFIILFFISVNILTHKFMSNAMKKRMARFVNYFMILIFVKLMLYAFIIVVYSLINKPDAVAFIITFFVYYLFFTVFELITILQLQKQ